MLPAACVAIHVIASTATPVDTDALLARCNGILGANQCRVIAADETSTPSPEPTCWRATVTLDEKVARAAVELYDRGDERSARRDVRFEPRDRVEDRWATLGLVVAALVTVEEHSAASVSTSEAGDTTKARPKPPVSVPAPAPAAHEPRASRAFLPGVESTLSGVAGFGFLPGAALGLRLEAAMYFESFGALFRGSYTPLRSEATVHVVDGIGGGRFSAWSLGVGACARTAFATAWTVRGCAGGDVTATTATGFGVKETSSATAVVGNFWLGPAVELRLARHAAVELEADGIVASQRPDFSIRGAPTVFTPSRFGANIALGLTAVFR